MTEPTPFLNTVRGELGRTQTQETAFLALLPSLLLVIPEVCATTTQVSYYFDTIHRLHSALYSTHFDGSVGKCFWQMVINLFNP